jgi:DNA-binding transcriptional regulator YhcF (GntR family)
MAKSPGRAKKMAKAPTAPASPLLGQQLHYVQVAKVICLLLDTWGKPAVSILALEPALAFALQPDLKVKSGRGRKRKMNSQAKAPVAGLDLLYQRMEQRGIIKRVGQHGYKLVDRNSIANATTAERDNARQAIERLTQLMKERNFDEDQARSAVAAAVETPYEVSSV